MKYNPTFLNNINLLSKLDKTFLNELKISFNEVKKNKKLLEQQECKIYRI